MTCVRPIDATQPPSLSGTGLRCAVQRIWTDEMDSELPPQTITWKLKPRESEPPRSPGMHSFTALPQPDCHIC